VRLERRIEALEAAYGIRAGLSEPRPARSSGLEKGAAAGGRGNHGEEERLRVGPVDERLNDGRPEGLVEVRPSARLICWTPEPDLAVARAARLCYSPVGLDGVQAHPTASEAARLLAALREAGHLSPFEHASFQFYIEGSRAMLAQITRHRIASYSVQSLRYVVPERPEYVVPPRIRRDPELLESYRREMRRSFAAYRNLMEHGVEPEDARMVLGQGVATRLLATFNARSLHNFFRLRCCRRAQWEIRQIAWRMRREVLKVAPLVFEASGPACEVEGRCREGRFSCGRDRALRRSRRDRGR